MNKQFTPKKVVIYGEDGDRVELTLDGGEDMTCKYHQNQEYHYDGLFMTSDEKMDIHIDNIKSYNMTYYVRRAGKRYRKNRRGYR